MNRLNSQVLRGKHPTEEEIKNVKRLPIYFIIDNVLDTYNIGSIFRLADAMSVEKVYLCGRTETPPNHRITKASVNTWQWVPWEYKETTLEAIKSLPKGTKVIAIEQTKDSIPYTKAKYKLPLALIVGHETTGVSKSSLKKADTIIELPLHGINNSLNVVIALGIIGYKILESTSGT
jgi:tRNA G18 (ribose-2'-O)-methylase SpoU